MSTRSDGGPSSLSPLELLLPKGFADGALVLGGACPPVLMPLAGTARDEGSADLIVIAPTKNEQRDPAWVRLGVRTAAARLSADGLVYVVPAHAWRLRRALVASGLEAAGTLLHLPDVSRSRHVVPVGTEAERYALSRRLGMKRWKRLTASAAMRLS